MAELERGVVSESIIKDIANIVAEKTLSTKNFTRFPVSVIIKAMETIHYAIKADETAKKQALVVIKLLTKVLPMRRIRMRIALTYLSTHEEKVKNMVEEKKELAEVVSESEAEEGKKKLVLLIEPNLYRDILNFMKSCKGTVDVEDQYGELAKGKANETDSSSQQEFMQLLENYEKFHISEESKDEKKTEARSKPSKKSAKDKTITCTSCKDAVFENPKEYRGHVKSGWHVENLKRKMEVRLRVNYVGTGTAG
eukprot:TRINITY_DN9699_c0_g2_i9.p1 TRINITY_DN9699_c0_g2~~TRINITY_DN9699_c0_g2_i9.p1  ORF type:complete len:253 (-),score=81.32 TRINITY_DN9699_c0_g2_i9:129-887(-)